MSQAPSPPEAPWHIGVDVGGTFTDLALIDAGGNLFTHKTLSRPADPSEAVLANLSETAAQLGLDCGALMRGCRVFVHGSTLATNVLLEQKGARVGLLTTAGFRDALEIRRGIRKRPWEHRVPYPPVLVPRYLRLPADERVDRNGTILKLLEPRSVEAALRAFAQEEVESVAICFLNSYLNPENERAAEGLVRAGLPGVWVSVSTAIAPIAGEYERQSTTVVDAYVAPRLAAYLSRLDSALSAMGLRYPMMLVKNNGGTGTVAEIMRAPVALTVSGPAAIVGALRYVQRTAGADHAISLEVGGTSTDVALMANGAVNVVDRLSLGDYDMAVPSVEVHSVGAGGGTIAGVDRGGGFFAGPGGAGAVPGPACYGRGGTEPTVTDAQLVLGRLRPGSYARGALTLDPALAARAVKDRVARPLGLSVQDAALGIVRVVEQKMLHALQYLSVQRGHDPRRLTLVIGGGAGGLHACAVARMLGCRHVYIPRIAGVLCAFGMLHSDVRQDVVRSLLRPFTEPALDEAQDVLADMRSAAMAAMERQGFAATAVTCERSLDLRYRGQVWDVRVNLAPDAPLAPPPIRAAFETEYERQFGHRQPGADMEIVKLRLTAAAQIAAVAQRSTATAKTDPAPRENRRIYVDDALGTAAVPVYSGGDLRSGHALAGPLLIEEETTTILLDGDARLRVDAAGNYRVDLPERGSASRKHAGKAAVRDAA
jgi:N-methylhydantoinase A